MMCVTVEVIRPTIPTTPTITKIHTDKNKYVVGETAKVMVSVLGKGGNHPKTAIVHLYVNGREVGRKQITVYPNKTYTLDFLVKFNTSGTMRICANIS